MPNKNTPPKHKTPNYRLVRIENRIQTLAHPHRHMDVWRATPLRSNRKDLRA